MRTDDTYPHADLVIGYMSRKGVKSFHAEEPPAEPGHPDTGVTYCGLEVDGLINAGWARQLRRRGLDLCRKCAAAGANLDVSP